MILPFNKHIVYYKLVKENKISFIIEFDIDKGIFVKKKKKKKINIEIFSPDSNTLMRKYHNRIKTKYT